MKNLFFLSLLLTTVFFIVCDKDDDDHNHGTNTEYDYHAQIMMPDTSAKHMNGSIHLHVVFESHAGEPVHNVNVRIYEMGNESNVIYDMPTEPHIHATSGTHEHHDDFDLTEANGLFPHSNWVLEAKVWGMKSETDGLATETLMFHVHPE